MVRQPPSSQPVKAAYNDIKPIRGQRKVMPNCTIEWKGKKYAYNLEWEVLPNVEKPISYIRKNYSSQLDKAAKLYCYRPTNAHNDYTPQLGIGFKACGHRSGQISLAAGMANMYQGSWISMFEVGNRFLVTTVRDATIVAHGDMVFDKAEDAVAEVTREYQNGGLTFIICDAKSAKRLTKLGAKIQFSTLENVLNGIDKAKRRYIRRFMGVTEALIALVLLAALGAGIYYYGANRYGFNLASLLDPTPPPPTAKRIYNTVVPVTPKTDQ